MTSDASRYEELQGRLRGVLITVSDQLPSFTVGLVDEMIDANECGVALETMSEMLVEADGRIEEGVFVAVEHLVQLMGLDESNVDRLRPLVIDGRHAEDE
jgi:hypothetical protein